MKKIKELYIKYKEIINYLIFGVLATVVKFGTYILFSRLFNLDEVLSSGLSWFCAVLFAYITNKIFVFDSKTVTFVQTLKEVFMFFIARILSGILCDVGTFALMVKIFHINDIIATIVTQAMVVIMNYILSKTVVFSKKHT